MTNAAGTAAPQAIVALAAQAARAAAAAIEDIARQAGASIIRRPGAFAYPESPAAALRIVSRFEHAARTAPAKLACPGMRSVRSWASASSRATVPARSPRWRSTVRPARAR